MEITTEEDITEKAIATLRSNNDLMARMISSLSEKALRKTNDLLQDAETIQDVNTAVNTAKIVADMLGLTRKENTTNVQINQITGFTFIPIETEPPLVQLDTEPT